MTSFPDYHIEFLSILLFARFFFVSHLGMLSFDYYMKIVPSIYQSRSGSKTRNFQYSFAAKVSFCADC